MKEKEHVCIIQNLCIQIILVFTQLNFKKEEKATQNESMKEMYTKE